MPPSVSPVEPEGDLVTSPPALHPNTITHLTGQHVSLVPLSLTHIPSLYTHLGGVKNAHVWRYIPNGPFLDLESFTQAMTDLMESTMFFPFAILKNETQAAISVITYMNISPPNLCLEIGSVLFGPALQRTTAATETVYLLLHWAFEIGGYQRVEWKANDRNEPSKRAATRLGFVSEGCFRKHMVVKGRRRDTAWFSMLDEEWVGADSGKRRKSALEGWLAEENFMDGRQVRRLEDFRSREVSECLDDR